METEPHARDRATWPENDYLGVPGGIDQRNAHQGAQVMVVESSRLIPMFLVIAMISLICGALGMCFGLWAMNQAKAAKTEAEISTMRTEGFTRALIAKGIDPYPHIEGEPP